MYYYYYYNLAIQSIVVVVVAAAAVAGGGDKARVFVDIQVDVVACTVDCYNNTAAVADDGVVAAAIVAVDADDVVPAETGQLCKLFHDAVAHSCQMYRPD